MSKLSHGEASAALPDWRYLLGRMHLTVDAETFGQALSFVNAVGRLAEEHQHHPEIDLRFNRVHLAMASHDVHAITERDVRLGKAIADVVRERRLKMEPTRAVEFEIAIDALEIPKVRAFWEAVTGYEAEGEDSLVDPDRIGPKLWFQQMDEPRTQRNRIHLDLTVAHDEAVARLEAAKSAGGVLVSDEEAPSFWVLADPEGNGVWICTWQDRDERDEEDDAQP